MTSVNNRPEILSKLGVGSGLDTSALIESLVEAEIAGPKEQLEQRESDFSARISAFSQIKNNLKVFKDNLEILEEGETSNIFTNKVEFIMLKLCKKEIDNKNVISKIDIEKQIYSQKFNQMANTLISNLRKNTNIKFFNK